jgi:uncharacterized membrane protein
MTSTLFLGVLLWLHVFSAIGWLGGDLVLLIGMEPRLGKLSPAARSELTTNLFPRLNRLEMTFATATILFGFFSAYEFTGGDLAMLSPATPWGLAITVGAALGLAAFLLEVVVEYPSENKVIAITRQMLADGKTEPPPELSKYHERSEFAEAGVLVLLLVALAFMVASGLV